MRILLCDDESVQLERATTQIREGFNSAAVAVPEIVQLTGEPLKNAIETLFKNVTKSLNGDSVEKIIFDDHDMIIVDNNLSHVEITGARLTAEALAGYLRGFSSTPYVVSLNKNPDTDFDLRFLIGDYQSRADLAINTEHLSNGALWTGASAHADNAFCPSYWPRLRTAATRRKDQVAFVRENLDRPVLVSLKFPEFAIERLSRHAQGFLVGADSSAQTNDGTELDASLREVTFRQVFEKSGRSLPIKKDRAGLSAENANKPHADEIIARVVAGEVDSWMRRDVIGAQEVLVDIPHLLARLPILLGNQAAHLDRWNAVLESPDPLSLLNAKLVNEQLIPNGFQLGSKWWTSPTFWWPPLEQNEELRRLMAAPELQIGDFVFCEDTSRFIVRVPEATLPAPQEFVTELEGGWSRRYAAVLQGRRYTPRSRFAA